MPNKTIYVSDGDLTLYQQAQELAGGNLSAAIAGALRRYVDVEEGRREGFDEIIVRVGPGAGRKVRFTGVLLGDVGRTPRQPRDSLPRLSRPQRQVRPPHRAHARLVDASTRRASRPAGAAPRASATSATAQHAGRVDPRGRRRRVDELRDKVPPELFDMVAAPRSSRPSRTSTSDAPPVQSRSCAIAQLGRPRDDAAADTARRSSVRGLRKSFGKQLVLDGIDLEVAEGTVFALLGPNGAGKTTTSTSCRR